VNFYAFATNCILFSVYPCECPFIRDHILKVCEHSFLQTAGGIFMKPATWVQSWTKMNWVDFEVKGQGHSKIFRRRNIGWRYDRRPSS